MRGQFFIRLSGDPAAATVRWVRIEPGQHSGHINLGTLEEAASQSVGCRVIALVPSSDVLVMRVAVPTANRQRMLKAIPFALEEHLADDVDSLHFAVSNRDADGRVAAAVVDRARMDAWHTRLRDAGIQPDVLTPDFFALPSAANEWRMAPEGDVVLVRTAGDAGFAIDAGNIQPILRLAIAEAGEHKPATLHAYGDVASMVSLDAEAANDLGVAVAAEDYEGGLLALVAKQGFDAQSAINLLQGDYSRREQLGRIWRPWRLSAILAGVWLLLQLSLSVVDNVQLARRDDALREQVEVIFKEIFPDARNAANAKVRMQRKLEELRGGGADGASLLSMLDESGAALKQTAGLTLRSIRYKTGVLDIELEVPNLQVLDQLKQQLSGKAGLAVEIQSAAARGDKVEGRLQIKKATP